MALKLFILGLPGSGKSTISRQIRIYLRDRNWESVRCSDHVILKEMFQADLEHQQFRPSNHDGFDVLDPSMCDIALQRLEQTVNQYLMSAKQHKVVLIEFARNNYQNAFQQFNAAFLQDSYFIHLRVNLETCKNRVLERTAHPITEDDFYVSDYTFSTYYYEDDGWFIPQILVNEYGVGEGGVKIIDNNGALSESIQEVYTFVNTMCGLEPLQDS